MKIEITHDSLAKTIYERADGDDKMRLKVANFIHTKHQFYKDNNKLLDKDDLAYIKRFTSQIILSKEEEKFIRDSEIRVKSQNIITWVIVGFLFLILIWLVGSNYKAWFDENKSNQKLAHNYKILRIAKDSIQSLWESERELKKKIDDKDALLDKTNAELKELVLQREMLIAQLEEKNKELKAAYKKIEGEKEVLTGQKIKLDAALATKIMEQKVVERKLTTQNQSFELSKKAQLILSTNTSPSDQQFKEAFLLSRAAWELYKENNQAMDVLNEIKIKKLPSGNNGFLERDQPKYTYTHTKIEQVINRLSPKYGKLSKSQISSYLK